MFELPEVIVLAEQMNYTLWGKRILQAVLGNSPHKFVWYNRSHAEFEHLCKGKVVGETRSRGKWLFVPLDPGYVLLIGECGGKIFYHPPESVVPEKFHLHITFVDHSHLTIMTQMWGAVELYEQGKEMAKGFVKGMRPTPREAEFTLDYFNGLVESLIGGKPRSAKALLTQEQLIPGLGNAIAQDILFHARLHPRHPISKLSVEQRTAFYHAIQNTVYEVIDKGGRYDEYDLYGKRGGYVRLMDSHALERPCPECGGKIEKMQFLGGTCYFCPNCQQ